MNSIPEHSKNPEIRFFSFVRDGGGERFNEFTIREQTHVSSLQAATSSSPSLQRRVLLTQWQFASILYNFPKISKNKGVWRRLHLGALWSLVIGFWVLGCAAGVKVQVQPLSPEVFPQTDNSMVLDEWKTAPKRPYLPLAKLIATRAGDDEEDAVKKALLARARQLGADGVIIEKSDVLEEMGGPRYNTASTSEGEGSSFPGFGVAWFAEESSSDSRRFTYYLSAFAIKYLPISSSKEILPTPSSSTQPAPPIGKK